MNKNVLDIHGKSWSVEQYNKAVRKAVLDIHSASSFAQQLINENVWEADEKSTRLFARSYSIAAIICYARPFTKSYGLPRLQHILSIDSMNDNPPTIELNNTSIHKDLLLKRDQIVAHSDSDHFSIVETAIYKGFRLESPLEYLSKEEAVFLTTTAPFWLMPYVPY